MWAQGFEDPQAAAELGLPDLSELTGTQAGSSSCAVSLTATWS